MKNILLIIHKLSNGGAEKSITTLANSLMNDYNVTMVVFNNSLQEYIPNVNVIDLKLPPTKNVFKKFVIVYKRVKKVKQIKKELNIDCSISYLPGGNLVNCLSKNKEKVIISVRNIQSKLKHTCLQKIGVKVSLIKADKIVVVSEDVGKDLQKHYKFDNSKVIIIPNMVNIEQIEKEAQENIEDKEWDNDKIKIINIGRLIEQKGQWHTIKAFKEVTKVCNNVELYILGRGKLIEDYNNLVNELELNDSVHFINFKINPYKYLSRSNLFILSSIYEGMPNVVLEAMACGLPIIATNCQGGTREILEDKNNKYGILIPNFNDKYDVTKNITQEEKMLSKTIIDLINNKDKINYFINQSKKRVKDFEIAKIKEKWVKIIEK